MNSDLNRIKYIYEKKWINIVEYCNTPDNDSPLHTACMSKQFEAVQYMIKHGVDVNSRDYYLYTLLYWSINVNDTKTIIYPLHHGADPLLANKDGGLCSFPHDLLPVIHEYAAELLIDYFKKKEYSMDFPLGF